ncbi:aldehyde oxidase GLOX-like [Cornus florida]|uniref:aldehyde oxidase GLOX-like n=1 Tax=Cornus florida TaxID=4283 RepID=UPI00289820F1|nr:aldehyde oxidase GLOX-like [Cornus florida]
MAFKNYYISLLLSLITIFSLLTLSDQTNLKTTHPHHFTRPRPKQKFGFMTLFTPFTHFPSFSVRPTDDTPSPTTTTTTDDTPTTTASDAATTTDATDNVAPNDEPRAPKLPDGEWVLLHKSVGISAMHMQLMHDNKVVIFDRTDFGVSNLSLASGQCRHNDAIISVDCSAHSLIYDLATNTYRPLTLQTDVWCSSGAVDPEGTLVQTGGFQTGDKRIRLFTPCKDGELCDWAELPQNLTVRRWYATNQILPDGRVIIVGGRAQFNYEFYPKKPKELYKLPFLRETSDPFEENNLYPFVYLLPDGNVYIFANNRSISYDYVNHRIIKEFPVIPGEKRSYPATGASVLLPIRLTGGNTRSPEVEVMICGGANGGAYLTAEKHRKFVEASKTCGRLKLTDPKPQWVMEEMPMPRVMPDMVLLPTGDIIIVNGASNGTAGWEDARGPVLNPLIYMPGEPDPGRRFSVQKPSTIPRMYHSTALLLPDGRVLVGGSNPHSGYNFSGVLFPTELSLEVFLPHYLGPQYDNLRPTIVSLDDLDKVATYGHKMALKVKLNMYRQDLGFSVAMIQPSFATHSIGMNQRLLFLDVVDVSKAEKDEYKVFVNAPASPNLAPPGYYMLFVVHSGIPGQSIWIKIK